jgi:hypothetical protein
VSPLRVEAGIAAAVPRSDSSPLLAATDLPWLRQLRFAWDSVGNSWNQWVLGYNPERQMQFLSRLGWGANWQDLAAALLVLTGLAVGTAAFAMLYRMSRRGRDPVGTAYRKFCRKLAAIGAGRKPSEGPRDYAARIQRLRPDLGERVRAVSELYIALRYGRTHTAQRVRELQKLVAQFKA